MKGGSLLDGSEIEVVGEALDAGGLMGSDDALARGMDKSPLTHRTEAPRDRLGKAIPVQPAIHRLVAVFVVLMANRPFVVRQIVLVLSEQEIHSMHVRLRHFGWRAVNVGGVFRFVLKVSDELAE